MTEFFKEFNEWIPNSKEIFIDVADYHHVKDGPVVLIVGHFADFIIDASDDKIGLVHRYKRNLAGSNTQKLAETFASLLHRAQQLAQSKNFHDPLVFDSSCVEFFINDRALFPNTPEVLQFLQKELTHFFTTHLHLPQPSFAWQSDTSKRAGGVVTFSAPFDITQMLELLKK